jgi:integrase
LHRDELAKLLPILSASERPYPRAMRFMLLTLVRREEVGSAQWRHVDLEAGTWTIPETKNGQPHVVPLSRQAVALLRAIGPGGPDALVFAVSGGGPLVNWDRETKAIMEASGTEGWHRHDLRRTGATMLGEMGELPDIIEAALNHVAIRSALASIYNRSRYRPQVAAALQRLADALDGIEAGAGAVVPLRRVAAE